MRTWRSFCSSGNPVRLLIQFWVVVAAPGIVYAQEPPVPPGPGVQHSESCARCHANVDTALAMRDADGRGIAPFDLWQGTMMANAGRDPLFRAALSAEVAVFPERRAEIERACLQCHAPMAARAGLEDHGTGSFAHLLDCDSELGDLARDGVSCSICHGMSPEGLGTPASFTGGFELDPYRRLFGPHEEPFETPMVRHTGFTPAYSDHVTESALCGSCHTLETETLDAEGEPVGGRFLEQAPFLEWQNSMFSGEGAVNCQDCHVPRYDGSGRAHETRLAHNPRGFDFNFAESRSPYGRHAFVGGNTLVLAMLRDHSEELRVDAPAAALQATLDATRTQLEQRTALVAVERARREEGELRFDVRVQNRTGHKLPTGHPTRRAWLRVVVRDAAGQEVFVSGAVDPAGRILGADGAPLASERAGGPIEPHRDVVRAAEQVAIYQAVMGDSDGVPTHTLLRGDRWSVDGRLLPGGWDPEHPDAARTAPVGVDGDPDFRGGSDVVHFALPVQASGPLVVEAELLYQTLSARWAAELFLHETEEIARFRAMYEAADRTPVRLSGASVEL